jgi:sterol desaturase/sphingolipid hydroxylase (fatty acid hydroxylase superfamily)
MKNPVFILLFFVATVTAALLLIPDPAGANVLVTILAISLVMIAAERVWPGAEARPVRGWYVRSILLNIIQLLIVIAAGMTWNRWMSGASLFNMAARHDCPAVGATYLVSTFVFYWWHRYRHESEFWWRFAHQVHHSVTRLEVLAAFYKNPAEILVDSLMSSVLLYPVMGCSPQQGACYTLIIALAGLFYHWNVRTPRWIGHWIQRPESHRIHHARLRHTKNYGDLPLWDKLFGTFANPARADNITCGFDGDKESRLTPMLRGESVEPQRGSEPLKFNPVCFGCPKRSRCVGVDRPGPPLNAYEEAPPDSPPRHLPS